MPPNNLATNQTTSLTLTLPALQKQVETRAELKTRSDPGSGTPVPVVLPLEREE